jgi:RNA polymerase sigma factor (sigma-70 family)
MVTFAPRGVGRQAPGAHGAPPAARSLAAHLRVLRQPVSASSSGVSGRSPDPGPAAARYAGLVRACVRPRICCPGPAEDLLQVGYVGLLEAINNFDPACGDSLGAYAQPCVSGEIKRHFRDRRWRIRVSRQDQELLLEMRAAEETLTQQLGRTPEDRELRLHLGAAEDDVRHARGPHSLHHPLPGRAAVAR